VPAHEKLVVGRENVAVEYLHRGFEQRRVHALKDHAAFAGKGAGHRPPGIAAGKMQVDETLRQCGAGSERGAAKRGLTQKAATTAFSGEPGVELVHNRIPSSGERGRPGSLSQAIGLSILIASGDQFGVAMQGDTNRWPFHAPASVLAATTIHISARARVSTVPTMPKKARSKRRAEAKGRDRVDAEREGIAPPAEVERTPARQ
jgi:hypothetical protein